MLMSSKAYETEIEDALFLSLKEIADYALGINIELIASQMEQKGRDMAVDYILTHSSGVIKKKGDIHLLYLDNITNETLENARKCRVYDIWENG